MRGKAGQLACSDFGDLKREKKQANKGKKQRLQEVKLLKIFVENGGG